MRTQSIQDTVSERGRERVLVIRLRGKGDEEERNRERTRNMSNGQKGKWKDQSTFFDQLSYATRTSRVIGAYILEGTLWSSSSLSSLRWTVDSSCKHENKYQWVQYKRATFFTGNFLHTQWPKCPSTVCPHSKWDPVEGGIFLPFFQLTGSFLSPLEFCFALCDHQKVRRRGERLVLNLTFVTQLHRTYFVPFFSFLLSTLLSTFEIFLNPRHPFRLSLSLSLSVFFIS